MSNDENEVIETKEHPEIMVSSKTNPQEDKNKKKALSVENEVGKSVEGWASLPHDLLLLILELFKMFEDFSAFGTVCKSWHATSTKERFKALWFQERTPYLMLPVRGGNVRDLYSLAESEIVASVRVPNLSERKCYESLGWFLAVEKNGCMCLFDPFSRKEIPLPPLNTLPCFSVDYSHKFVKKMVLSARPNDPSDPSDFVVGLIFRGRLGVAFWKPGDNFWHLTRFCDALYEDITYHAGNFYAFDEKYQVTSFNILKGFPEEGQLIAPYNPLCFRCMNVYLVKMPGSLLLVASSTGKAYPKFFKVYEFQISSNTWTTINDLGNMALFLGSGIATTIVDTSRFPGFVKANHIYFTDDGNTFQDYGESVKVVTGQNMGVYNLGNRRIDPFYHGEAFNSKATQPDWILPFLWS